MQGAQRRARARRRQVRLLHAPRLHLGLLLILLRRPPTRFRLLGLLGHGATVASSCPACLPPLLPRTTTGVQHGEIAEPLAEPLAGAQGKAQPAVGRLPFLARL